MKPIQHKPLYDVDKIISHYSEKDGVEVKYVCTSDLTSDNLPADIFYRATPHPQFGNHYFGIYHDGSNLMICNADVIETLDFGVIEVEDRYHYSRFRHDFNCVKEGYSIDGGRKYIRVVGCTEQFTILRIKEGEFVPHYPVRA